MRRFRNVLTFNFFHELCALFLSIVMLFEVNSIAFGCQ
ncbi:hypothetical protein HMPREF1254_1776 [Prevotella sp. BV3P1]|nr:hypothetical protein HMPREF1254_1776 [Prevotella sp. BV3P1]